MTTNQLGQQLGDGGNAIGAWCVTPSPFIVESLAAENVDYVGIDCQHGLIGYEALVPMLMALGHRDATPVVRLPNHDPAWAGKALDAGAELVIVPGVNSAAEAEAAASACRYPPGGTRSFGPVRSALFLGAAPPETVNDEVMCFVMIETVQGVEHADAICATRGVDGIYVGPGDLAVSMGYSPGFSDVSAEHSDAIEHIRKTCDAHGIVPGIHTGSGANARAYLDAGYRLVSIASEMALLRMAARQQFEAARAESVPVPS